jgi:hypothetical protein
VVSHGLLEDLAEPAKRIQVGAVVSGAYVVLSSMSTAAA